MEPAIAASAKVLAAAALHDRVECLILLVSSLAWPTGVAAGFGSRHGVGV